MGGSNGTGHTSVGCVFTTDVLNAASDCPAPQCTQEQIGWVSVFGASLLEHKIEAGKIVVIEVVFLHVCAPYGSVKAEYIMVWFMHLD